MNESICIVQVQAQWIGPDHGHEPTAGGSVVWIPEDYRHPGRPCAGHHQPAGYVLTSPFLASH